MRCIGKDAQQVIDVGPGNMREDALGQATFAVVFDRRTSLSHDMLRLWPPCMCSGQLATVPRPKAPPIYFVLCYHSSEALDSFCCVVVQSLEARALVASSLG